MGRRAKTLTKQKRIAGGGLCASCGSEIDPGRRQKRYENPHLCKDCNGETKVEFMPSLAHIAAEMEAIKAERINFILAVEPQVYQPPIFANPMHGRMRAGNRVY